MSDWRDWDILIPGERFDVRVVPQEYVIIKDQQYLMNYALCNLKTMRPEIFIPTEIACINIHRDFLQAIAAEEFTGASADIIRGIFNKDKGFDS